MLSMRKTVWAVVHQEEKEIDNICGGNRKLSLLVSSGISVSPNATCKNCGKPFIKVDKCKVSAALNALCLDCYLASLGVNS